MDDRALAEVCAALAEARRRIAAGHDAPLARLPGRLASLVVAGPRADSAALIALLDELMGLVGQLELERAAIGARLTALERHRRAGRHYTAGAVGA